MALFGSGLPHGGKGELGLGDLSGSPTDVPRWRRLPGRLGATGPESGGARVGPWARACVAAGWAPAVVCRPRTGLADMAGMQLIPLPERGARLRRQRVRDNGKQGPRAPHRTPGDPRWSPFGGGGAHRGTRLIYLAGRGVSLSKYASYTVGRSRTLCRIAQSLSLSLRHTQTRITNPVMSWSRWISYCHVQSVDSSWLQVGGRRRFRHGCDRTPMRDRPPVAIYLRLAI